MRIGHVGKSHGYEGGVYLETPAFPGVVAPGCEYWCAGRVLLAESAAGTPGRPLARFAQIGDRGAAAALGGAALWAPRADLPPLGADEWYASDLEGMAVFGDDGGRIGVVRRLINAPSVDVLEVELDGGGELLVPLGDDAVERIDTERRRVTVHRFFLGLGEPDQGGSRRSDG